MENNAERQEVQEVQEEVAPFRRNVIVAKLPEGERSRKVWVNITWDGRGLRFSGIEGPMYNGDAVGSCGQIQLPAPHHVERSQHYERIGELWRAWHMNDMVPGCAHQRAAGWGEGEAEVVTYRLTSEAIKERGRLNRRTTAELMETGRAELDDDERALLALPYTLTGAPNADGPEAGRYEVERREMKRLGWVRPDEHPEGVLGKPCPECGYQYGTAWLRVDVPVQVLQELEALPDHSAKLPHAWL